MSQSSYIAVVLEGGLVQTIIIEAWPENDPERALELGEDNDVRTEIDVLNVSNTNFWFSADLKHADVEIWSERKRIDELAQHFDLPSLRTGADHEVL